MPHGQASKEARVFKNFAAPSGIAGESFMVPWTNGVDGDDLSFFVGDDSNSDGIFNWYLQGVKVFRFDHSISHLDAATGNTIWGAGNVYLGKTDARWRMIWARGWQSVSEDGVWAGEPAVGHAAIATTAVTGAAQALTPPSQIFRLSAGSAASVLTIAAPPGDFPTVITIIFDDANVTLTDSGTGGAAETMNLNGGDYTSSADGVVRLLWCNNPATGNDRWLEISRTSP